MRICQFAIIGIFISFPAWAQYYDAQVDRDDMIHQQQMDEQGAANRAEEMQEHQFQMEQQMREQAEQQQQEMQERQTEYGNMSPAERLGGCC